MADAKTSDKTVDEAADQPAGVPDGTVLTTPEGQPDEVVVNEYDDEGNVTGFHKEVVKNG